MLNGRATVILLIFALIKKILLQKMSYVPEPHNNSKRKNKIDYICLIIQQNGVETRHGVNTSAFAKKANLSSLTSDIDKLEKIPNDLSSN